MRFLNGAPASPWASTFPSEPWARLTTRRRWSAGTWLPTSGGPANSDFGRVFDGSGAGGAFIGRLRVGPQSGLNVTIHLAERDGVDPVAAVCSSTLFSSPAIGFLAASGWSGGALATAPLGTRLSVRAGAQVDSSVRRTLVASTGSVEIHVVLDASSSGSLGRSGSGGRVSTCGSPSISLAH